jgi:hypothetical protein
MPMDFDKIYSLGEQFNRRALRARPVGDALTKHRELSTGVWQPEQPVVLRQADKGGSTPKDLVGTESVDIKLFSDRAIDVLRNGHFTGWKTYPVELFDRNGRRIPGYRGLAVSGRSGPIDPKRSAQFERISKLNPRRTIQVWRGLLFDPSSCDGSDMFQPMGTAFMLVTEPVKDAFEKAKITNVRFQKITEMERFQP